MRKLVFVRLSPVLQPCQIMSAPFFEVTLKMLQLLQVICHLRMLRKILQELSQHMGEFYLYPHSAAETVWPAIGSKLHAERENLSCAQKHLKSVAEMFLVGVQNLT